MSFNGAMYNFPPGDAPLNQQTHTPMPPSQSPPALGFQPQERVLPYNANTPSPSSSFSGTSLIDPLMIDNLAQDFNLEPTQRANLHAFVTIGTADGLMERSDLLTRMYLLAAIYADSADRRRIAREQGSMDMKEFFTDLKIRLEGSFTLTKEQTANIRKAANDIIYQPTRTNFTTMHLDLDKYLREQQASLGLSNVYGRPAREQVLASQLKKTCSSVRNSFRQDIRDSILGKNKLSLETFTYQTANKYRRGQFTADMDSGYAIHNAILRRFALENIDLIRKAKKEGEDDD
ncbi:hypothetical protein PILCRDRAFT_830465, partial [Piloderma croceum F 1598]